MQDITHDIPGFYRATVFSDWPLMTYMIKAITEDFTANVRGIGVKMVPLGLNVLQTKVFHLNCIDYTNDTFQNCHKHKNITTCNKCQLKETF